MARLFANFYQGTPQREGKRLPSPHTLPCLAPFLGSIMAATSLAQLISVKPFACFMWEANSHICSWIAVRSLPASPSGLPIPWLHRGSAGKGCRGAAQCPCPQGSDKGKHMARKQQEETSSDYLLRTRSRNHLHTSPSGMRTAKRHPARAFPTPSISMKRGICSHCSAPLLAALLPPAPTTITEARGTVQDWALRGYFLAQLIKVRLSTLQSGGKAKGLFFRRSQLPEAQLLPVSLARYMCWRATVGWQRLQRGQGSGHLSSPFSANKHLPTRLAQPVSPTPASQVTISAATPMRTARQFGEGQKSCWLLHRVLLCHLAGGSGCCAHSSTPVPQQQQCFALCLQGLLWFICTESGIPRLFPRMKINFKCW